MNVYDIHTVQCTLGWSVEFFFDWTEQVYLPKVRHDFRSLNPKFRHTLVKVFIFKKFQGAQIQYFL